MPLVQVTVREGTPAEHVRALISALTDAVVQSVYVKKESVRVIVTEVQLAHWAAGDVTLEERERVQE